MDRDARLAEIAELRAILELPAGTTCYLADIHGQGNKFFHIINNKAGSVRRKIREVLPGLDDRETLRLLKLCYYPEEYLARNDFSRETISGFILALAGLVSHVGSKLTRKDFHASVSAAGFPSIVSELVTNSNQDKIGSRSNRYQTALTDSLIDLEIHRRVILDLTTILRRHLVFRYIINGDIPDRGRDTAEILDHLVRHPEIRVNWGNHDLLWMGAAAGSRELVCEVVRIQLRYGFSALLESDYGIALDGLRDFAVATYRRVPASGFYPAESVADDRYDREELARMQKTMAVLLWKLESARHDSLGVFPWLRHVRFSGEGQLCCRYNDEDHILLDTDFPTFDPDSPESFTPEEAVLMDRLLDAFTGCRRLRRQMQALAGSGSLFTMQDGILSFHAIIPVDDAGVLLPVNVLGREYAGRSLFETLTGIYRAALQMPHPPRDFLDLFYQGWKGENSWTFGKRAMQTFPRALFADTVTHREEKAAYYRILADPAAGPVMVDRILDDFTDPETGERPGRIFNGHIPVRLEKQEEPVRAGGRVICGDGGFSEAYGDVGFVLVVTSRGLYLNKLGTGITMEDVLSEGADILPETIWQVTYPRRRRLKDCSVSAEIQERIRLLSASADLP